MKNNIVEKWYETSWNGNFFKIIGERLHAIYVTPVSVEIRWLSDDEIRDAKSIDISNERLQKRISKLMEYLK